MILIFVHLSCVFFFTCILGWHESLTIVRVYLHPNRLNRERLFAEKPILVFKTKRHILQSTYYVEYYLIFRYKTKLR